MVPGQKYLLCGSGLFARSQSESGKAREERRSGGAQATAVGEQREVMRRDSVRLLLSPQLSLRPPTLRLGLPSSVNPFWKHLT